MVSTASFIRPPELELAWYAPQGEHGANLAIVVRWLLQSYAKSTVVRASLGADDVAPAPIERLLDEWENAQPPVDDVVLALQGVNLASDARARVSVRGPVLSLVCGASAFCGPPAQRISDRVRAAGERIASVWIELSRKLSVWYGAILIEDALKTPQECDDADGRTMVYRSWISSHLLSERSLSSLREIADGFQLDEYPEGACISLSPLFDARLSATAFDHAAWSGAALKVERFVARVAAAAAANAR